MGIGRHSKTAGTLAVLAAVSLGAGACAQRAADGTDLETVGRPADFEATPEYLAAAVDDSQSSAHRFEMTMDFEIAGHPLTPDEPLVTGASDGERTQVLVDFGGMFETMAEAAAEEGEDMPEELLGGDLTMETVTDETTLYMRAPFLATMAELAEEEPGLGQHPAEGLFEVFGSIGDGWAKIDLTALGDIARNELGGFGGMFGSDQNMDPRAYLEMIAGAEGVEELGSEEIDGEPVTGLAARVNVRDMLEAQGVDPEEALDTSDFPDDVAEDFLMDFEYDVHVWIDGDANIRRLIVDMGAMMEEIADEMDEELPVGGFNFRMTMDFFDYGDESIAVELPADAVDITSDMVELAETLD